MLAIANKKIFFREPVGTLSVTKANIFFNSTDYVGIPASYQYFRSFMNFKFVRIFQNENNSKFLGKLYFCKGNVLNHKYYD